MTALAAAALLALLASPAEGLFVAAGDQGGTITSADGLVWSGGNTQDLNAVAYWSGHWVAVGNAGTVRTSTDGLHWSLQVVGAPNLLAVATDGTLWVAVGVGAVYTSTDTASWVRQPAPATALNAVANGAGLWVAVGANGLIATSRNGAVWTTEQSASASSLTLNAVATDGTQFVAVGSTSTVLVRSASGTWTPRSLGSTGTGALDTVSWASGVGWVAAGTGGKVWTSLDTVTWKDIGSAANTNAVYGVRTDGTQWVAVGAVDLMTSPGPPWTWTVRSKPSYDGMTLHGVAHGGGAWVAVGLGALILRSPDAVSWSHANGILADNWNIMDLASDGHQFLQVASPGNVWNPSLLRTSPDGVLWTNRASMANAWLQKAATDGSRWVVVGSVNTLNAGAPPPGGIILTSPDGATWTQRCPGPPSCPTADLHAVAYGGGLWVAVGQAGAVLTSTDAVTWVQGNAGTGNDLYSLARGPQGWVAVGAGGTIVASAPDGTGWAAQASGTTRELLGVASDGRQFVAAGASGQLLHSTDGASWVLDRTGPEQFESVATNGTFWVAAGLGATGSTNIVATSRDGRVWTVGASGLAGKALETVVADTLLDTARRPPGPSCLPASQDVAPGVTAALAASGGVPPYTWTSDGSDPGPTTGVSFLASFAHTGNHDVQLQDAYGDTATCTVAVHAPPLSCTPASQTISIEESAHLAASGGVPTYAWQAPDAASLQPDGSAGISLRFGRAGTYSADVTDQDAPAATASCAVVVLADAPPAANPIRTAQPPGTPVWPGPTEAPTQSPAGVARDSRAVTGLAPPPAQDQNPTPVPTDEVGPLGPGPSPLSIFFDGEGLSFTFHSNRPPAAGATYGWEFGDGSPTSTAARPNHVYTTPGAYDVTLTALGADRSFESASTTVHARAVTSPRPQAARPVATPSSPAALLAAGGAAVAAVAWLALRRGDGGLVVLFSRLRESDLELHPTRAAILEVLRTQPGLHEPGLARVLGKGRGTVAHHLRVLCAAGLVQEGHWEGTKGYWPAPGTPASDAEAAPAGALRTAKAQGLLELIRGEPGIGCMELAQRMGLNQFTARYHLDRLAKAGLVSVRRQGRENRYYGANQTSDVPRAGVPLGIP